MEYCDLKFSRKKHRTQQGFKENPMAKPSPMQLPPIFCFAKPKITQGAKHAPMVMQGSVQEEHSPVCQVGPCCAFFFLGLTSISSILFTHPSGGTGRMFGEISESIKFCYLCMPAVPTPVSLHPSIYCCDQAFLILCISTSIHECFRLK
jgi:hypothetical protein